MADNSVGVECDMPYSTLKSLKIPYEIEYSDKLVEYLMRIAECRPFFLDYLSKPLQVSLLRNAKVRAITYSNQIEGNSLKEDQVSELVSKKKKDLSDDEAREVQNYADALDYAEKLTVAVQPFADGNGRTCRLMQHLLLLKSGEEIVRYVPSETAIMHNRDEYYKVIRQTKKLGKLTPVLKFLAKCFAESAEQITKEAKDIVRKTDQSPAARKGHILKLLKKKKEIKIADVVELLPEIPRRTLERDLENLCKEKKIKAKGEKRARVYIVQAKK